MIQRFQDWRHERYIRRVVLQCKAAMHGGDKVMARLYWNLMIAAIGRRSVDQVARMERRQGLI